jgi:predicted phage baseplate assembly protein
MPLEDALPIIDDRRFEDLFEEVRQRIPRYSPEWRPAWNDLNDNDPGIAMVQVFTWLAETLIYRMNKIPALAYVKFLQMVGIELQPAQPARVELTFPVKKTHPQSFAIVPLRTQVSAEDPTGAPGPVVFETERAIFALRARLASVLQFDGYANSPLTQANDEAGDATLGWEPFGPDPVDGAALLLGFDDKDPLPAVELALQVWMDETRAPVSQVSCDAPTGPAYGPARLRWEYWGAGGWRSLTVLKDETRAFTRTGQVLLKLPAAGQIVPTIISGEAAPRAWLRARLEATAYERAPALRAIRANTVAARQAETVRDEVLGGSDGGRDQVLRLARTPVLAGSLALQVDEGSGFQDWSEVDDLFGAGADDAVYVLNRTSGEVRFGDGEHGRIPTANPRNRGGSVVARSYRVGGGKRGNAAALAVKTLLASIDGVDDATVGNVFAAYGGVDEERLDEAKKRAPQAIRSRGRAVTAEDFEQLARGVAGIRRARALPLVHPDFPGVSVPGVVTLVVVPDGTGPAPVPSEGTLRTVCACLDGKRLLTTELVVVAPTYVSLEVRVEAVCLQGADLAELKVSIEQSLTQYFHPLTGGEDGTGWPFGGTIFYSRAVQRVFATQGVNSVTSLVLVLDGDEQKPCADVRIAAGALLSLNALTVDVQDAAEEDGP